MSVFLVNLIRDSTEDLRFQHECLALGYLTAALEAAEIPVQYVDRQLYSISEGEIIQQILEQAPILVGITANVQETFPYVVQFIHELRSCGYKNHITVGGVFATIEVERILREFKEIDSVSVGEGETIIVNLYKALESNSDLTEVKGVAVRKDGRINKYDFVVNEEIDRIHMPARRDVPRLLELGRRVCLIASRGCIGNCVFCSSQSIKRMGMCRRQRSPENVIEEMLSLFHEFHVTRIKFNDPVFIAPGRKGEEWGKIFCKRLSEISEYKPDFVVNLRSRECINKNLMQQLAQAGMSKVVLGIEPGSDSILKWMHKPTTVALNNESMSVLKGLGIKVEVCFIFFVPVMTLDDVIKNINFLRLHNELYPFQLTSVLEVYCGSEVLKILENSKNYRKQKWWDLGSFIFFNPSMELFWEKIQPVLNDYNTVINEIYILDVMVQKNKKEHKNKELEKLLDELSAETGEYIAESYIELIELIRKEEKGEAVDFSSFYQRHFELAKLQCQRIRQVSNN